VSLSPILERARASRSRIVVAPGDSGLGAAAQSLGLGSLEIIGPGETGARDPRHAAVAELLRSRRPQRVRDGIHALDLAADPVRFAVGLVALGEADGMVGGPGVSARTLADAAEWTMPAPRDGMAVRAVHWLVLPGGAVVALADCQLAGRLDAGERVAMGVAAAAAHARLGNGPPRVAFLAGPDDDSPETLVAGFAAIRPGIPATADRRVRLRDGANVLIFPGGESGHLALRTARDLSGARVLGPLLVGPPGVIAGVAEDADFDEMAGTIALAALMAAPAGT
jgi:phosphotransacetylase